MSEGALSKFTSIAAFLVCVAVMQASSIGLMFATAPLYRKAMRRA